MRRRHLILALGAGALLVGALPTQIAHASGPTLYVSPFGSDTGGCTTASSPCQTITYALAQSADGDTISLARGAYVEQVEITDSVKIVGAGEGDTTIVAPSTLVANSQASAQPMPPGCTNCLGETYIVDVDDSGPSGEVPTVSMSNLTVAGPGPVQTGGVDCVPSDADVLATGIDVWGGATLHLSRTAVEDIYDRPINGCGTGEAISIGSGCLTCSQDTGIVTLSGVKVSAYQQDGVAVRGLDSSLSVLNTNVLNNPNPDTATTGIEIDNSAYANITRATITGNECNDAPCGPPVTGQDIYDSTGSTTFTATTATDPAASWTANYANDTVTAGSSSSIIKSNTTNTLTLTDGDWTNGIPAAGTPFTITSAPILSSLMGTGIAINGGAPSTKITKVTITGNDAGVVDNVGVSLTGSNLDNNRFVAVEVGSATMSGVYKSDKAISVTSGADQYGFLVEGRTFDTFSNDTATGNAVDDMFLYITAPDTNTYSTNTCTLASPSTTYWDCT